MSVAPHSKIILSGQFEGKYIEESGHLRELIISELRRLGVEVQAGEELKQYY